MTDGLTQHIISCQSDLQRIVDARWTDEAFLMLGVFESLREVTLLLDKWRLHKTADNEAAFSKKMMDLFVLLLFWQKDEGALLRERVDVFLQTIAKTVMAQNTHTPDIVDLLKNPQVVSALTSVYGEQRMNEYIQAGFLDLCLEQRRIRITEQAVCDDEQQKTE